MNDATPPRHTALLTKVIRDFIIDRRGGGLVIYGAAALSGAVASLSLPPYGWWPISFLSVSVLIWLLDYTKARATTHGKSTIMAGFLTGWWFAFGYFVSSLYWIGSAMLVDAAAFAWTIPFAITGLPIILAIFWGLATALAMVFWHKTTGRVWLLAGLLAITEIMRGELFSGFPWNSPALMLDSLPGFTQMASITGVYGLNLLAILFSGLGGLLWHPIDDTYNRHKWWNVTIIAALGIVMCSWGTMRINSPIDGVQTLDVRIIQPAIPQQEKWLQQWRQRNIERYFDMSSTAILGKERDKNTPMVLIWPESALPVLLDEEPQLLQRIGDLLGPNDVLITGSLRRVPDNSGLLYNSILVIDHNGKIADTYDKVNLVPFGEYLPFSSFFDRIGLRKIVPIPEGFKKGTPRKALNVNKIASFWPIICYEAIFPAPHSSKHAKAMWVVNVTNDGWFGDTIGPYQHLAHVKLRAIEMGIPIARAANTGISAIIDSYGQLNKEIKINQRGVIDAKLTAQHSYTLYSRFGLTILLSLILFSLILSIIFIRFSRFG